MPHGFKHLIDKIKAYNPSCDFTLLQKAYDIANREHAGQQRHSGDPYIVHPLEVGIILAELGLDTTTIIAGLLHDTVEDTNYTLLDLEKDFGNEVALLVDGVTKLEKIQYKTKEEQQAENFRKMFVSMAKDIRVILIKLADRLHNMRTLKYQTEEKRLEKSKETLEIYAPIAHRLGISKIKWELEDICLRYIDSKGYYELVNNISSKRKERESFIHTIIDTLLEKTRELGIESNIDGRPKHFFSIYRKMKDQDKTLDQIYDLFAVRVIVDSVKDCYTVLGLVHELFKPLPGRFKDYIAMPKPNMYQSLHTTLIGPAGIPFEIQIRTWAMHQIAEVGIAAHWKYKEGRSNDVDINGKLAWLKQLIDWQKDTGDANEYMETLKVDLFTDEVFIFTPRGDVISLRSGSCPIDFAYAIHSAVGNKMMGAKVNNKIVTLDYELKNGDICDILTSPSMQGPKRDWLKICKTSQARNKINQWFKKENRDENISRGKDSIERELKKSNLQFNDLFKPEWIDLVLKKYNFSNNDDLFAAIGLNAITPNKIITRLKEEYKKTLSPEELELELTEVLNQVSTQKKKKRTIDSGIMVKGIDNCLIRISRCCTPLPGDPIVGYVTRGRGVSIHRKDCNNIGSEDNRIIEVEWKNLGSSSYIADLSIIANDRPRLVLEITNILVDAKLSIKSMSARTTKDKIAIITFSTEVISSEQLDRIINKLNKIKDVHEIKRTKQ